MSINYPKNERRVHTFLDSDGDLKYIITEKKIKDGYYLYEHKDGVFIKLGKAKTPLELERKYKFRTKLIKS